MPRLLVLACLLLTARAQGRSGYRLFTKRDAQWHAPIARVSGVLLVLLGVALLAVLVILSLRQGQPVALVAVALTTSGYFGSKPRYLLPAFPFAVPGGAVGGGAAYPRRCPGPADRRRRRPRTVWLLGPGPR